MKIKILTDSSYRPTVGDIIKSPHFSRGIRYSGRKEIMVGWDTDSYLSFTQQAEKTGKGKISMDDSRGNALFLVTSVKLENDTFPDDVEPGVHFMAVQIKAVRLTGAMELEANAEQIYFTYNNPMAVIDMACKEIELQGKAGLPVLSNYAEE